uniref:MARVEL domain-containing protein n=1 Tax=Ditylenchus dipsaci TaxID=166011 RepID=A0A915EI75_9BILA
MANYVYHDIGRRFNCLLWDVEVALAFAILFGIWDIVNLIFFNLCLVSTLVAIDLFAWIGILFASVKQVPQLYLPALVVNLVYIVLHVIVGVSLLVVLFLGDDKKVEMCNSLSSYTGFRLTPLVVGADDLNTWLLSWFFCFLVSALFMVFVEVVVYRAYIKMKEENSRHHIPIAELDSAARSH